MEKDDKEHEHAILKGGIHDGRVIFIHKDTKYINLPCSNGGRYQYKRTTKKENEYTVFD